MRLIVHLSDLHFGRLDETLLEPLARRVKSLAPHLVVVSGDITQRARSRQFRDARRFLDALPHPQLVTPGNHDVPLYNLWKRFYRPYDNFRRYIAPDLAPAYVDEEIAVVGINTARALALKGGRINEAQIERVRVRLCALDPRLVKILVTHHPFDLPPDYTGHHIVGRAGPAMEAFARCGADILLAGHLHVSHAADTTLRYKIAGFAALVVQAGTATSTRGRGETNSFNALRVTSADVRIDRFSWEAKAKDFLLSSSEAFDHAPTGWRTKPASGLAA